MKRLRTNSQTEPPTIEDLGDGTYYYNFNIDHTTPRDEDTGEKEDNYDYDQVRLEFPVDETEIQQAVDNKGFEHTVKLPK